MSSIRNIAIIAHVDHGKTTLVDQLIYATEALEKSAGQNRITDSNAIEKERGITILSKNVSVHYKGHKINIIDTPGHADFGGEVERVLKMADGVLLLVDAHDGVMPQTRFVLGKAIQLGLVPMVVVNKLDKPNSQPLQAYNEVVDLMFHLDASEEQLEFFTLYGSARDGWMSVDPKQKTDNIFPLLDAIIEHIPAPQIKQGVPQFQVTSLDFSQFKGRIAIGRVYQGELKAGDALVLCQEGGGRKPVKIKELHLFEGLGKRQVERVGAGDICAVTGLDDFKIGDTLTDAEHPMPLPRIAVDEPTMSMLFMVNDSPFNGRSGKFVTSTQIEARLEKEQQHNLALRVEKSDSGNAFLVYGRGVLHLGILIENMLREGYELQVGQPQILYKTIDGKTCEPIEELLIDVPESYSGKVIDLLTKKKADLLGISSKGAEQQLQFDIPARGLIGLRSHLLTLTGGQAVMNHSFKAFQPYKGDMPKRLNGALVSMETGVATAYAMNKLQDRGVFFIEPGMEIYKGQVIGEHTRPNDLAINLIKGKKLTNMRAAGSDNNVKLAPRRIFTLESSMEYIGGDELVELTPDAIRMRKKNLNV